MVAVEAGVGKAAAVGVGAAASGGVKSIPLIPC